MLGKIFTGFDLETGSEFTDEGPKIITEIGAVKYVYTRSGFKPVDVYTAIVNEGKGVHPDAVEYTGITPKLVSDFGRELKPAIEGFDSFISDSDYIVSHNGDAFDLPVLADAYSRCQSATNYLSDITNIDTMTCISYPNNCKSKNLTYLQAFFGFVNPFPHRAYADVMAMMKVMEKSGNDVADICKVAESPQVQYVAEFSYPKESRFNSKDAFNAAMSEFNKVKDSVKSSGFRWTPETKQWIYTGKELIFERDIQPTLTCRVSKL